jgi:hypothetical protein
VYSDVCKELSALQGKGIQNKNITKNYSNAAKLMNNLNKHAALMLQQCVFMICLVLGDHIYKIIIKNFPS